MSLIIDFIKNVPHISNGSRHIICSYTWSNGVTIEINVMCKMKLLPEYICGENDAGHICGMFSNIEYKFMLSKCMVNGTSVESLKYCNILIFDDYTHHLDEINYLYQSIYILSHSEVLYNLWIENINTPYNKLNRNKKYYPRTMFISENILYHVGDCEDIDKEGLYAVHELSIKYPKLILTAKITSRLIYDTSVRGRSVVGLTWEDTKEFIKCINEYKQFDNDKEYYEALLKRHEKSFRKKSAYN